MPSRKSSKHGTGLSGGSWSSLLSDVGGIQSEEKNTEQLRVLQSYHTRQQWKRDAHRGAHWGASLVPKLRKRHWPGPSALPVDTAGAERNMRLSGQRELGLLSWHLKPALHGKAELHETAKPRLLHLKSPRRFKERKGQSEETKSGWTRSTFRAFSKHQTVQSFILKWTASQEAERHSTTAPIPQTGRTQHNGS